MKCIILAAGYATRLYPLTENMPKPLLEINGKTILDWLIDDIETSGEVSEYIVISNHKFADNFKDWAKEKDCKITVVDDGTMTNETRLGAVKDIQFAIEKLNIEDDALVIAGDNVLDFSLTKFIDYAKVKNASCVLRYYEERKEKLQKSGVMKIDENERITEMVEKPKEPQSSWCCPPFYFYTKKDLGYIEEGIRSGCGTDAPGSYVAWLSGKTDVYAMEMPGRRYDIGNLESYEEVQRTYNGIKE